MVKSKVTRKFAVAKKIISPKDLRVQSNVDKVKAKKLETEESLAPRKIETSSTSLFFSYNASLGPPYQILIDTNFINFSIKNKLDIVKNLMDTLVAKCTPCITDCVMGELEKLGSKYRLALSLAKDPRFERIPCGCKGTYADDCLVNMSTRWKCFIVATCDKELRRRVRKIPGVPCMYIKGRRFTVERMPEAFGAPR